MRLPSVSWTVAPTEARPFALRCRWNCVVSRRRAHSCRRSYDAIGEKIAETWVGGNYTATYQYNAAGELTQASDPFSSYAYSYDADGRLVSVSNAGTPGVPSVTLSYAYDAFGDRTSMSDSLGGVVSYSYDGDLRLSSLGLSTGGSNPTLEAQVTFAYDNASRLTGLTQSSPGGVSINASLSYDNADELTNLTYALANMSLTPALANYTYGYDAGGQLTSYQDNNSSVLTYSYDANGELTGASGTLNGANYSVNYSYDLNGNRTMPGYQTGTGNELLSDGTYKYTYDNDGNMTSQTNIATGTVTYYTWDYRNRLVEVKQEDNQGHVLNDEKFTYDINNNRIAVSLNGTPELYTVYDGANPYLDFNGNGQLTQRYLYNPNALSQFYGQVNASGTVQWFLTDNIHSIRQVVSSGGSVLDALTYDPYGNIVSQTNAANGPRFLYAGGAYDTITGQYQFGRRYEDPTDGRWTSQDPLSFAAGDANLYRYTYNDPAILTDSSGELGTLPIAAIGAGVGAVVGGISAGFTNGWTWQNVTKGASVGAVAGGVAGLTLGLAGPGIAAAAGGGWFGSGLAGATAGVAGDIAGQGFAMGMGWQDGFSGTQLVISGGVGFVFGAGGSLLTKIFLWNSAPARVLPRTPEELDGILGIRGTRIPDSPTTPGRGKVVWELPDGTKITFEQPPYHPSAPDWHRGPHYHVDPPGGPPHQRLLPGDPIPGS